MKNWRTVILIILTVFIFWFIKFFLKFPSADNDTIGIILTVASILFGFLAGFFISELWTRYTSIREMQGKRSSEGLNMIRYAGYFFSNKKFENEFKKLVEKSSVVDEAINWDEGHLEIPYFRDIEDSFKYVKVKKFKDQIYFDNLLDSYHGFVESIVRLSTLYKERLFASEWFMMITLSLIITFSILFLDISHFFYQVIVLSFPVIIILALSVIYDLDTLVWGRNLITLEPIQMMFDAIGRKRFYLKKDVRYATDKTPEYRTEDTLEPDLKEVYTNILSQRK